MIVGIFVGYYAPMNMYARNGDCFSTFWNQASNFITYHIYFDGKSFTASTWIQLTMAIIFDGLSVKNVAEVCLEQYSN